MNLTERDRKVLWHPYTQEKIAPPPVGIVRGRGVWLYTEDGRKILDAISSWWVNIHGHAHPFLNEALAQQANEIEHLIFAGFTHRPAVELAEKLVAVLPPNLTRVFYSDNGSTAVEVALKMAYQFWQNRGEQRRRKTFVALENAYHGDTLGAMAASGASAFTKPFAPLLFDVLRAGNLEEIERIFRRKSGEIAAVIIEPMLQGAGGMIVWEKEFVAGVRRLCDEHDVLLIADEVLTGFGRTGKMFACEHALVSPDIICLSKALTAGYLPLGATVASEEIYNAFLSEDRLKTFFHGHSFTANPLACAVAAASLQLFEKENCLEKIQFINRKFNESLPKFLELNCVSDVRIVGAVGIIEIASSGDGYFANVGQMLYQKFLARNILLRPLGNVLYFMPPYVIEEREINWVLDAIDEVLDDVNRKFSLK
ncbi:MAG: adenosylmethionine--8-amino-7-oxononanoate transaminase [Acidobacteria bacterium]|jgi:adenosylmethionine-8-amino-7-oxononanoate aminotransferase|nr:adenosylmethionine--8-amino-7-oxononanoate transaminase [Acidobacteriota bacterium]